jgi:hypothetical protein
VIVTQRRIGEETESLEHRAPLLWKYLMRHSSRFTNRRSSIYRGQPPFALFGIGPYSFAPFKVAISGLHRTPLFRAVGPRGDLPVMCDDTCYHLPCKSASEAALLTALCNHRVSLEVARALSFPDAKRAITKGLLQRIDLSAILKRADRAELQARASTVLHEDLCVDSEETPDWAEEIDRVEQTLSA